MLPANPRHRCPGLHAHAHVTAPYVAADQPRRRATASDLLIYLGRRISDQQIHCVLTFDRTLDAERLARAMRLALDAEPVLGSRFVERPWHSHWERRGDLDACALCALERTYPDDDRLQRFMVAPCDPRVDPLLRVLTLRSDVDTVCFKVDHVAADASGLRDAVALVAAIYARLADDPRYRPEPNRDGDRGFRQVLRRFSLAEKAAALRRSQRETGSWCFPATSRACDDRVILVRHFAWERLAGVRAYRRAHRATTNDLLLAAFFRALFAVINPPEALPLPVSVTVDLRHLLPQQAAGAIGNLAGAVFPAIAPRTGEPFDATLVRVRDAMRAIEGTHPGLGGAVLIEALSKLGLPLARRMFGLLARSGAGTSSLIFSNLGSLSTRADFGGPKVTDGYLVGPIMFPGAFMLALSSSGRTLTVTVGFCQAGTRRADVERVLDHIQHELLTL